MYYETKYFKLIIICMESTIKSWSLNNYWYGKTVPYKQDISTDTFLDSWLTALPR
jgi:hypothetical protein